MLLRIATCVLVVFALAASSACKHPYSGKPERLRKPRPKRAKKGDADKPLVEVKKKALDDKCRTNFFADPGKASRRNAREARSMSKAADRLLVEAEQADEEDRTPIVTDAIRRLSNALRKDPYGPLPTYKLAVAYALIGKKGCALALLERLKLLQSHPPVEREATRSVKRAVRDLAFDKFRDDARAALGE